MGAVQRHHRPAGVPERETEVPTAHPADVKPALLEEGPRVVVDEAVGLLDRDARDDAVAADRVDAVVGGQAAVQVPRVDGLKLDELGEVAGREGRRLRE